MGTESIPIFCWDTPTVLDYLQDDCYMGAIVGRFANRIGGATFTFEDHEYTLEKNDGANTNHGGYSGFHSKIWKGSYEGNKIVFRLSSAHLEGGYPGNVEVTVWFLLISMECRIVLLYLI